MAIIEDILVGVKKASGAYITIPDRKEAIRYCMEHAQDGDVIVLAGKGHEDYQEINGTKYHMDERELIQECGRLAVPGRPILYQTTKNFLRSFGLSSLEELPELPDASKEGGQMTLELEAAVAKLQAEEALAQMPENAP